MDSVGCERGIPEPLLSTSIPAQVSGCSDELAQP